MTEEYVSFKQLASELGMDRSHARKYVLKLGVKPASRRTPDSGGQLTLTASTAEATLIRRTREEQGFDSARTVTAETGFFYVIQLVPDLDPKRVKLGFASNVATRLAEHRTAAPTAKLLKLWPCKRNWERTAIDALAVGGRLILNEVFEFSDVEALIKRGDELFALLPDPSTVVAVSDKSPHRGGEGVA